MNNKQTEFTFEFSDLEIDILKSFSSINSSIVFNTEEMSIRSQTDDRLAFFKGFKAPTEFAINSITKMISVMDKLKTKTVNVCSEHLAIRSDDREVKIRFVDYEVNQIKKIEPGRFSLKDLSEKSIVEFDLTEQEIMTFRDIAALLENNSVEFILKPGELVIKTHISNLKDVADTFTINKKIDYNGEPFKLIFTRTQFQGILSGNYRVGVNEFRAYMKLIDDNVDDLVYIIVKQMEL